ncbi:MAG: hypothetical protein HYW37_01415 [Candidatus Colwellbacteria bacterium]|nr:hypothetical protein [Candidatus Colwellbacteria bacterium]
MDVLTGVVYSVITVFAASWWAFAPVLLFAILSQLWLYRIQTNFIKDIKWVLLEFEIPKENLQSPKAMEQVFASLHATYSFGIPFWDKWWKGRVEAWMTLEMVAFARGIHFYVRCWEENRNLVETALFSQYPGVEIHEAEEYVNRFGSDLPNAKFNLFGADLILNKPNPYPIKTYPSFEDPIEERRVDPLSAIAEVMSNLKDDEMAWIQILVRPTGAEIKKEAEDIIAELAGRKKKAPAETLFSGIFHFIKNLILGPAEPPVWPGESKSPSPEPPPKRLTPGEMDVVKAIENKVSKTCFHSIIRFLYIDSATAFTGSNVTAIMGGIRHQFDTQHLNSFRPSMATLTIPVFKFSFIKKKARLLKRKENIFRNYKNFAFPIEVKPPILCTEELATIFHPPISYVGAPKLWRLEAKKGEPPGNLPI